MTTPGLYIILGAPGRFLRWLKDGPQPGQEIPENGTGYVPKDDKPPFWDAGARPRQQTQRQAVPSRRKRDTGLEAVIRKALKRQQTTSKGG